MISARDCHREPLGEGETIQISKQKKKKKNAYNGDQFRCAKYKQT